MARRSKYTPQVIKALEDAIGLGMTDADACHIAQISEETFYLWQRTKPEFLHQVTRARSIGWQTDLSVIKAAGLSGDWRAAEAHLALTRSPYRKVTDATVTHTGNINHSVRDMSQFTDSEIDALSAIAERLKAGTP